MIWHNIRHQDIKKEEPWGAERRGLHCVYTAVPSSMQETAGSADCLGTENSSTGYCISVLQVHRTAASKVVFAIEQRTASTGCGNSSIVAALFCCFLSHFFVASAHLACLCLLLPICLSLESLPSCQPQCTEGYPVCTGVLLNSARSQSQTLRRVQYLQGS